MFGDPFYYQQLRKYTAVFGTLFNNIKIAKTEGNTPTDQLYKVPLSYGPREKYLAMVRQKPGSKRVAIQLPRMSFEMTGVEPDSMRKYPRTNKYYAGNGSSAFEPAPYNINMQLNVISKNVTDALMIVEQILPYFNSDWTVSMQLVDNVDRFWDIPIVRISQEHQDLYEGDFIQRRAVMWTFNFVMKGWIHGPVHERARIKFITVNKFASTEPNTTAVQRTTIQPGLTVDGEPTSDIEMTIDYDLIDKEDDWGVIEQQYEFPFDED